MLRVPKSDQFIGNSPRADHAAKRGPEFVALKVASLGKPFKKNAPPLIVVLFVPEIPPKINGFVTLSGGWVSRKDRLVTLLRCHYFDGVPNT